MIKRGVGYSCAFQGTNYHFGHPDLSTVLLEVSEDETFEIHTAASDVGQGLEATLFTIVSNAFGGLSSDRIRWTWATTDSPDGGTTGASRQTTTTGNALHNACIELRSTLASVAAEMLDAPPEEIVFAGEDLHAEAGRHVTLSEVVKAAHAEGRRLKALGRFSPPKTTGVDKHGKGDPINQFGYATCAVEVEVDTDTGEVRVLKISAFHDSGHIIHRLGAEGQVEGGVVMGLGYAISEDFMMNEGKPKNVGFTNYLIPTVWDSAAPNIKVDFVDNPVSMGKLGVKGLAEIPNTVIAPAITNAIFNATGARINRLPATPERVFQAIKQLEEENREGSQAGDAQ